MEGPEDPEYTCWILLKPDKSNLMGRHAHNVAVLENLKPRIGCCIDCGLQHGDWRICAPVAKPID